MQINKQLTSVNSAVLITASIVEYPFTTERLVLSTDRRSVETELMKNSRSGSQMREQTPKIALNAVNKFRELMVAIT